MQGIGLQKILSGEFSKRMILVRPNEPSPEFLMPSPSDSVYIGKTALMGVPFFWNFKTLSNPHIAVLGMTGSGKSYFIKTFLTRASIVWGTNALILDWAGEYVPWVEASGGRILRLGEKNSLNLLDTGGIAAQDRVKQVMGALALLTDISSYPRQVRITEEAITESYAKKGMLARAKNSKGKSSRAATVPPTLHDVEKILSARYKSEKGNEDAEASLHRIRKFVAPGRDYFARKSTIPLAALASSGLVCIDLSTLPSEEDRSLAGLTILQFLKEHMRSSGWSASSSLKLIVVVDEAWKIAQDDRSDLVAIVREGRKYSFGIIVASQNPTDLSKAILSNAASVFAFRQQLPEFKSYVRETLHYDNSVAEAMEKFGVGQAAVRLSFSNSKANAGAFLLSRVDGEELLVRIRIKGGSMEVEIEREEFRRRLWQLGCSDKQAATLCSLFESNDRSFSASDLASELVKYGFSRPVILVFLRELGLPDSDIISLFSQIEARTLGTRADKIARLVVEDEG